MAKQHVKCLAQEQHDRFSISGCRVQF